VRVYIEWRVRLPVADRKVERGGAREQIGKPDARECAVTLPGADHPLPFQPGAPRQVIRSHP